MCRVTAVPAILVACVLTCVVGISDEEYSRMPRLFHLDDYEACLAPRSGLYCLGILRVEQQENPVYNIMKEYSKDPDHFNHTRLHRGYCVSSRCPHLASQRNTTHRFHLCAQQWAHDRGLRAHLQTIHYCHSHGDARRPVRVDGPKLVFLVVVGALLVANAVGTVYDVTTGGDKKNELLVAWSVRSNWRRLTAASDPADSRAAALHPLHGVRVVVLGAVMWGHAGFLLFLLHAHRPRDLEALVTSTPMMLVRNGSALVQVFVTLSSFLLSRRLLLVAPLRVTLLPKLLLLRYIRLAPVHLLLVGFAATWWGELRGGPVWPLAVGAEAAACRRKFWAHALYVHNLVEPEDQCLVQTWYLAVDMQLYLVAAGLTLALHRSRRAVPVLVALFLVSCLLNGALAYTFHWKTMLFIMIPENLRTMFRAEPSFHGLYTAPWGSLPACLLGLLLAQAHYHVQQEKSQPMNYRWLVWVYRLYFPLGLCWVYSGLWLLPLDSRVTAAVHAALERPVLAALTAVKIFGLCHDFGMDREFFAWRGWRVLSRLSLPALLLHWCAGALLAAARAQPVPAAPLDVFSDFLSTMCVTYLLATPVSLLLEQPVQRLAAALVS